MKKNIMYIIVLFCLVKCSMPEKNDIYKIIPIGSPLTKELLLKSEQIISYNSDLILMFNISYEMDRYDPHLLFFDSNLTLYAAVYFPSEKIESLKNNVITGYLNKDRAQRKSNYRNDLPPKYVLNLESGDNFHGSGYIINKVIERIKIDSNNTDTKICIKKSTDIYAGINFNNSSLDSNSLKNFMLIDTLIYPISDIIFNYKENLISTRYINSNNSLICDRMIVLNKSVLDTFYSQLWNRITNRQKSLNN